MIKFLDNTIAIKSLLPVALEGNKNWESASHTSSHTFGKCQRMLFIDWRCNKFLTKAKLANIML